MVKTVQIFINGELQYSTNVDAEDVDKFVDMRKHDLLKKHSKVEFKVV